MKLRRCDGCGETSEHTRDWGAINVPIVDLVADICTPKCGVTVLTALLSSVSPGEMGKAKWSVLKFRKHVNLTLGKHSPEDWCPQCGKQLVLYRPQLVRSHSGYTSLSREGSYCGNCGYNQDPVITYHRVQADQAENLTLDLEGER